MKKSSYTLIALLIVCLAVIGYLVYEKVGDQRQLKLLGEQVESLNRGLDALRLEKLAWEKDKARVAENLTQVKQVLSRTLDELGGVVDSIGLSLEAAETAVSEAPEATVAETTQPEKETDASEKPAAKETAAPAAITLKPAPTEPTDAVNATAQPAPGTTDEPVAEKTAAPATKIQN